MNFLESYARVSTIPTLLTNLDTFKSKFGVELEFASPLDWTNFRERLCTAIGPNRVTSQTGGYGARSGSDRYSKWSVTSDRSIATPRDFCPIELISPTFQVLDGQALSELKSVFSLIRSISGKTGPSTGLHISLSCLGLSRDSFRPNVFCALADDMGLLNYFGRATNHYCQATTQLTLSSVGGFDRLIKRHTLTNKDSITTLCGSQRSLQNYGKYVSVNTGKLSNNNKLVEYRGIGGDWLKMLTPELLIDIVKHLSGALIAATHLKNDRLPLVVAQYFARHELVAPRVRNNRSYPICYSDGRMPVAGRHSQTLNIKMRCYYNPVQGLVLTCRKERSPSSSVGSFLSLHQIALSPRRWLNAGRTPAERAIWASELLGFLTSPCFVSILRCLVRDQPFEMRDLHVVYNYVKNILRTTDIIAQLQAIIAEVP